MKKIIITFFLIIITLAIQAQVYNSSAYIYNGYTDKLSYETGDIVTFYLSGNLPHPWYIPSSWCSAPRFVSPRTSIISVSGDTNRGRGTNLILIAATERY